MLQVAITPILKSIATVYEDLAYLEQNQYIDTIQGKYLDLKVEERGLTRNPATSSFVVVQFPKPISNFQRIWKCDSGWNYTVSSLYQIQGITYYYILKSQDVGIQTNGLQEKETFVSEETYQTGNKGTFVQYYSKGKEEESDEDLKIRYLQTFQTQPQGGNILEYQSVVSSYPGVGACKIIPATQGRAGIVTVYIVDEEYAPAKDTLLQDVKEYLDPFEHTGEGYGRAPIGHMVEVRTISYQDVTFSMMIKGKSPSKTEQEIQTICEETIQEYFLEIRKRWSTQKQITIYFYEMIARILSPEHLGLYVEGIVNVRAKDSSGKEYTEVWILPENKIPAVEQVNLTYAT